MRGSVGERYRKVFWSEGVGEMWGSVGGGVTKCVGV